MEKTYGKFFSLMIFLNIFFITLGKNALLQNNILNYYFLSHILENLIY